MTNLCLILKEDAIKMDSRVDTYFENEFINYVHQINKMLRYEDFLF